MIFHAIVAAQLLHLASSLKDVESETDVEIEVAFWIDCLLIGSLTSKHSLCTEIE